jgi:hypothetical protein
MHPAIHCHLMQARTADLRHQVPRDALACRARRHQPEHPVPGSRPLPPAAGSPCQAPATPGPCHEHPGKRGTGSQPGCRACRDR